MNAYPAYNITAAMLAGHMWVRECVCCAANPNVSPPPLMRDIQVTPQRSGTIRCSVGVQENPQGLEICN